jgi:hypothetical protein
MRRPPVIEILDGFVRAGPQLHNHFFHLADHQHVFEEIDGYPRFNSARGEFGSQTSSEPVTGDLAAIDFEGPEIRS